MTYPIFLLLLNSLWEEEEEELINENIPPGLVICEKAQIFHGEQISITFPIVSQKNVISSKLSFLKLEAQKIASELTQSGKSWSSVARMWQK